MKVHYKKSIFERIDDEILYAERNAKEIDFISLTKEEWDLAYSVAVDLCSYYDTLASKDKLKGIFYSGVKLILEKD